MSKLITRNDLKNILDKMFPNSQTDYVIAQGVDGIWSYRKWSSGMCELWGKWTETKSNYSTVSPFYGYVSSNQNLPFTVYSAVASYVVKVGTGFGVPASGMGSIDTEPLTQIKGYALGTASGSQTTVWSFHIKGRWK